MTRILVLTALPEEAAPLFVGHDVLEEEVGPYAVRRAAVAGHDVAVVVCGLGKVNAALAVGLLVRGLDAELLVMSGTCGRIAAHEDGCFWLAEAVQHDYGAARDGGFAHYTAGTFPIGPAVLEPFAAMPQPTGLGLASVRVASGDSFVEDAGHASRLARDLGATVVDMEVAAMAQVADRLGIPWAAIKAVTDDADDGGYGDFAANLRAAAARAAAAVERLVHALP